MIKFRKHLVASVLPFLLLGGCVHDTWSYRAVPDVNVTQQNQIGSEGPVVFKIEPPRPMNLPPSVQAWIQEHRTGIPTRQTILVAAWQHDWSRYETSVGRTLVLMLNGTPKLGKVWITPDDAVLVTYSAYSAPTRLRVTLSGSFNILSIKPNEIKVDLAVLDTNDIDNSDFLDQPWDPVYHQWPFVITGTRTFAITSTDDPLFAKTGVKWVR